MTKKERILSGEEQLGSTLSQPNWYIERLLYASWGLKLYQSYYTNKEEKEKEEQQQPEQVISIAISSSSIPNILSSDIIPIPIPIGVSNIIINDSSNTIVTSMLRSNME